MPRHRLISLPLEQASDVRNRGAKTGPAESQNRLTKAFLESALIHPILAMTVYYFSCSVPHEPPKQFDVTRLAMPDYPYRHRHEHASGSRIAD